MLKVIGILLMGLTMISYAGEDEPLANAGAFKKALEQFNPSDVLSQFTAMPPEANINPTEHNDDLKNQGIALMQQNKTAHQLYTNEQTRTKAIANPLSPEMQYAEQLIEGSESVKDGGCVASPPKCSQTTTTKTCEDLAHYSPFSCETQLTVKINTKTHTVQRKVFGLRVQKPFDLAHCANSATLDCQSVEVKATWKGQIVDISQTQTCSNLMVSINGLIRAYDAVLDFTIHERVLEDVWDNSRCEALTQKVANSTCVLETSNPCFEPNATKIIEGIPVQRACWGSAMQYQCLESRESSCAPLIHQGCIQTLSSCATEAWGVCTRYSQTFECVETTCIPQPDICMHSLPCMGGECDTTQSEESHDMGEGVTRLGALAGVASEVANKQIAAGDAHIFAGEVIECEKYMLGSRNCCSDSGWADWVIHCPQKMQILHHAKEENRTVYLGDYKDGLLDSNHHYVYCLFPTKLASIIQIEGRGNQLSIPFGNAEHPNCSGITPLQLEHIDFERLNLAPIEKELIDRYQTPDLNTTSQAQQAHVEQMNREGRAHD